jgi:hypothetical protein
MPGDTNNPVYTDGTTITGDGTFRDPLVAAGGGGAPGGTTTAIQFNNAGAFDGDASSLAWDDVAQLLTVDAAGDDDASGISLSTSGSPAAGAGITILDEQPSGGSGINIVSFQNDLNLTCSEGDMELQSTEGEVLITGATVLIGAGTGLGFFNSSGILPPTITGVGATEPIAKQIVEALAGYGLVINGLT